MTNQNFVLEYSLQSTSNRSSTTSLPASIHISLLQLITKIRDSMRIPCSNKEIADAIRLLPSIVPSWCKVSEVRNVVSVRLVPLQTAGMTGGQLSRDEVGLLIEKARCWRNPES